ncbi:lipid-A-disaccharide synthase N-terminal domain-containing protein [Bacillus sp. NP157]|nr:lipid-A-disaccharide synthase N-terminal domain-containing protein [Bacillus sp. NP157]
MDGPLAQYLFSIRYLISSPESSARTARCAHLDRRSVGIESMVYEGFAKPYLESWLPWLYVESIGWTCVGLVGACLFTSRFLVQWFLSERRGKLVVPPLFWHLSFWGSLVSLVYALHLDKTPIILSYAFLPVLYGRNLWLLRRERRETPA